MRHFATEKERLLYFVWQGMLRRCYTATHPKYPRYGARGIRVCDEWHSFAIFYAWACNEWQDGLQIDRINNDWHYCPENCRFVTCLTNNRNKSPKNATVMPHKIGDSTFTKVAIPRPKSEIVPCARQKEHVRSAMRDTMYMSRWNEYKAREYVSQYVISQK